MITEHKILDVYKNKLSMKCKARKFSYQAYFRKFLELIVGIFVHFCLIFGLIKYIVPSPQVLY